MFRKHAFWHAVAILLALTGLALVVFGFQVHGRAKDTLKVATEQAAVQAAAIPVRECPTSLGGGYMGCNAPAQAYGLANDLAVIAGDPDVITSPIGIDVSNNNGTIDWPVFFKAHPNVKFVYDKATESSTYTDTQLAHNVTGERAAKVAYGVYDFIRCGWSTATAEADHFADVVEADDADTSLPPAADVEVSDGCTPAQERAYVATWDTTVKARLGRTPETYTDEGFWNGSVGGSSNDTGLWAADWATNLTLSSSWSTWLFWQYASGTIGPTPHIGELDMDTFHGTDAQLEQLAQTPAPPKPKPKPVVTHTATTSAPPPPPPASKGTVCFGNSATPKVSKCQIALKRYDWLIARRDFWQHEFNRCIRYADGIGCEHANRWFHVRGSEAAKLRKRYV